jgi:cytochrome c oxidase assembly protein subunit 15
MVSLHLILALVIVSLLIYTTQSAYHLRTAQLPSPPASLKNIRFGMIFLFIAIITQVLLGTQVRSQVELILTQAPLLFGTDLVQRIGTVNYLHSISGILVLSFAIVIAFLLFKWEQFRLPGLALIGLPILQVLTGSAMQLFGLPAVLQVFHLWLASLLVGLVLIIYTELTYYQE